MSKKYLNFSSMVDYDLHQWVMDQSTREGQKVSKFVERLLVRAKAKWEDDQLNSDNPVIQIDNLETESNRQKMLYQKVVQLANNYDDNSTERNAEILQEACDIAGINYEEFLSKREGPYWTMILSSTESTKISQCLKWLFRLMRTKDNSGSYKIYPARSVTAMASERGWNAKMVERAKAKLNDNLATNFSPDIKIDTHRIGNKWCWYFDDGSKEIMENLISHGANVDREKLEVRKTMSEQKASFRLHYSEAGESPRYTEIIPGIKTDLDEVEKLSRYINEDEEPNEEEIE